MKKTKYIELILITAALASCHKARQQRDWEDNAHTYIRSDSTASYTRTHHYGGSPLLWYYAFRPYGNYYNGHYQHAGYYSGGISNQSNIGSNSFKSSVSRGGFGRNSFSVSS